MKTEIIEKYPHIFAPRPPDSHKGNHGTLAIIGGAPGMSGALILAASAALLSGCGRVYAAFCQTQLPAPWLPNHPEIMLATSSTIHQNQSIDSWAIGCGMGNGDSALQTLHHTIKHSHTHRQPLVIDADALNLLAQNRTISAELAHSNALTVLTPHPAEAARLLACDTRDIQAQRPQSARQLAEKYRAWIVLKGHHTLIADPHGKLTTNDSGNAALATAGSGDVLTGMIAAFLAQQIPPEQAIAGAVWLHGAAADHFSEQGIPLTGLLAGEIAPAARRIRQQLGAAAARRNTEKSSRQTDL